jgi:hypothetical protein
MQQLRFRARARGDANHTSNTKAGPCFGDRPVTRQLGVAGLAIQNRNFVFDSQLLSFEFGEGAIVWVRPVFFFLDHSIDFGMLGPQGVHVLCHRHSGTSICSMLAEDSKMLILIGDHCKHQPFTPY